MVTSCILKMQWHEDNAAKALQIFKQNVVYYCEDEVIESRKTVLKILGSTGNEELGPLNASCLSDVNKKSPNKLWKLFETQDKPHFQSQSP